jgi:hypothetical protein
LNFAGAGAIAADLGRWLVYSQGLTSSSDAPTQFVPGGLNGINYYGDSYNFRSSEFSVSPGAGNRFVFGYQPTLTIAPTVQAVIYNGAAQTDSYTVTGLVYEDSVRTAVSGTANGLTALHAGSYSLTPGGLASEMNYAISYRPGIYTILPHSLDVKISDVTAVYGDSYTLSASVTGLQGSDSQNSLGENLTYSGIDKNAGTYAINAR